MSNPRKFWNIADKGEGVGKLDIYGDIVFGKWDKWSEDDVAASEFKDELDSLGDVRYLDVSINSAGGNVFAGQAIHSLLVRHPAHVNVHIDGLAASIASVIAMAGDTVTMPENAMLMIHDPWAVTMGGAKEMRQMADSLEKIKESLVSAYLHKVGNSLSAGDVAQMMEEETWMTAEEARALGFVDNVTEELPIAASASADVLASFRNVPDALKAALDQGVEESGETEERERLAQEALVRIERTKAVLEGLSFGRTN
jgi:ATP-dependent Clp protease, protease subunit